MSCRTAINRVGRARRRGLLRLVPPAPEPAVEDAYVPVGGNPMEPIAHRVTRKMATGSAEADITLLPSTALIETPIDS